ncbi:MAG: N-acetyl-1-D-myo-inositol-2-amino-2-deoxy-alpha-D-glucopyranoside deacetylase [Oryzihumus sp.]
MPDASPRRRLLFVHAHPDDETLTTGLTMAHYVDAGHDVHVLTCTLGEEGEVIPPQLRHLAADREDRLGPWRREELRRAMDRLGVTPRVRGEDPAAGVLSRYRDSGMAGTPSAAHPDAFAGADLADAAALLAAHLRALDPDVVVTYDAHGGYGHPDHIQTHRVTMEALAGLGAQAPAAFCIVTPQAWAVQDRAWLAGHVDPADAPLHVPAPGEDYPPSVVPDDVPTHVVEAPQLVPVQAAALGEHATQVRVFDGYYALSNDIAARLSGREAFVRVDPGTGRRLVAAGAARHTGLLAQEGER